jgi:hypothetical protein
MEKLAFTTTNLTGVRVIMVIMRFPMGELLCQAITGRIPVLECPLPGARECLRLRPLMLSIKWRYFLSN